MTHAWPADFPLVASRLETSELVRSPAFRPGKDRADLSAALALFEQEPFKGSAGSGHSELARIIAGRSDTRLLVPVPASTEAGNVLALAYAVKVGQAFGLPVDFTRKLNVAKHTGMSSLTRFTQRPVWDVTEVRRGARYVVVDDVLTSGVSLSEMRSNAMSAGALVVGVTTLAYTGITDRQRSAVMTPLHFALRPATVRAMASRFGDGELTTYFKREGIYNGQWRAMTEGEAWLIRHYRSVADFEAAVNLARQKERELLPSKMDTVIPNTDAGLSASVISRKAFAAWRSILSRLGINNHIGAEDNYQPLPEARAQTRRI